MNIECLAMLTSRVSGEKTYWELATLQPSPGVKVSFSPGSGQEKLHDGLVTVKGTLQKVEISGKSWLSVVGIVTPVSLNIQAAKS